MVENIVCRAEQCQRLRPLLTLVELRRRWPWGGRDGALQLLSPDPDSPTASGMVPLVGVTVVEVVVVVVMVRVGTVFRCSRTTGSTMKNLESRQVI